MRARKKIHQLIGFSYAKEDDTKIQTKPFNTDALSSFVFLGVFAIIRFINHVEYNCPPSQDERGHSNAPCLSDFRFNLGPIKFYAWHLLCQPIQKVTKETRSIDKALIQNNSEMVNELIAVRNLFCKLTNRHQSIRISKYFVAYFSDFIDQKSVLRQ